MARKRRAQDMATIQELANILGCEPANIETLCAEFACTPARLLESWQEDLEDTETVLRFVVELARLLDRYRALYGPLPEDPEEVP